MNDQDSTTPIKQSSSGWWLQIAVVIIVIVTLVLTLGPKIAEQKKKADMTRTTGNSKQIFYLMVEFDQDFGEFPSDKTAREIKNYDGQLMGKYSNNYFRQFIAASYTQHEEIFYAYGTRNTKKPDNKTHPSEKALSQGECGFAYIKGMNTKDHSARPLVLAPMYGERFKFDPYAYDGKAVVLRIDGSVKQLRINNDHHPILSGETTLFESGADTAWGEQGLDPSQLLYSGPAYNPR